MEKTIIIRITNPTKAQDALLHRLMRAFQAEHIEVQENTAFTLLAGNLQIDPQRRLVWQSGQMVDLTPMEFDILLLLAPGQGRCSLPARSMKLLRRTPLMPAGQESPAWSTSSAASWALVSLKRCGATGTNLLPQAHH